MGERLILLTFLTHNIIVHIGIIKNFCGLYKGFGGIMKQLVLILIAFIAVATFIRAFDYGKTESPIASVVVSEDVPE